MRRCIKWLAVLLSLIMIVSAVPEMIKAEEGPNLNVILSGTTVSWDTSATEIDGHTVAGYRLDIGDRTVHGATSGIDVRDELNSFQYPPIGGDFTITVSPIYYDGSTETILPAINNTTAITLYSAQYDIAYDNTSELDDSVRIGLFLPNETVSFSKELNVTHQNKGYTYFGFRSFAEGISENKGTEKVSFSFNIQENTRISLLYISNDRVNVNLELADGHEALGPKLAELLNRNGYPSSVGTSDQSLINVSFPNGTKISAATNLIASMLFNLTNGIDNNESLFGIDLSPVEELSFEKYEDYSKSRSEDESEITEDTTLHALWAKDISSLDLTVKKPECGSKTETPFVDERYVISEQSNPPEVKLPADAKVLFGDYLELNANKFWGTMAEADFGAPVNPYQGEFTAEGSYPLTVFVEAKFGYCFINTVMSINGTRATSLPINFYNRVVEGNIHSSCYVEPSEPSDDSDDSDKTVSKPYRIPKTGIE